MLEAEDEYFILVTFFHKAVQSPCTVHHDVFNVEMPFIALNRIEPGNLIPPNFLFGANIW